MATGTGIPDGSLLSTYGAPFVNAAPVENPNTDANAPSVNQCFADAAGMTRTACRAWIRFANYSATGIQVIAQDTMWGDITVNAVAGVTTPGTGLYVITYPTQVTDSLNVVHSLNFKRAICCIEGAPGFPGFATVAVLAANIVQVFAYTTSFAAGYLLNSTFYVLIG